MTLPRVLLHHTETVDPELVSWIRHLMEDVLGLGHWFLVIVIGAVIVAIPAVLVASALRRRWTEAAGGEVIEEFEAE